jgi:hypothetical protein
VQLMRPAEITRQRRRATAARGMVAYGSEGWDSRDAPILLSRHRSHCDGHRSIDDGTRGRHDADAGVSRHGDHQEQQPDRILT